MRKLLLLFPLFLSLSFSLHGNAKRKRYVPLYYWSPATKHVENFGDYLSKVLIEQMSDGAIPSITEASYPNKFLAIGSILHFASEGNIVWGSGINGKHPSANDYHFRYLDVRAVRGPLTKQFLEENFNIHCPEIYGDPCLLFPYLFPEYRRKENCSKPFIIIPHISEEFLFSKEQNPEVVYPTQPWQEILENILDCELVISSSLHGIILAEAFGVPARMLKITENEPLFKYQDYYYGTGRPNFQFATSIEEALEMGGEPPYICDLQKLYNAFPFDLWPHVKFRQINFH